MRVLADYHHAELYESLLLLFEDRFGWEVSRPVGHRWYEVGLWRHSNNLAVVAQFTDMPPHAQLAGDHYEMSSATVHGRRHRLVTYEQFHSTPWDFVLTTLDGHEQAWQRLADEIGARAIYQVGNANQPIDWTLRHLVLAAARIEVRGPALTYHPEFCCIDYRYASPPTPYRITNFMNCLSASTPAYEDWLSLQAALPEFEFREHGIDGCDGMLHACAPIGAAMRESGWAFHDKPMSDGYGFVIHQWAATGRPLLGRARYYAGRLAEPLWGEGITSLDLGRPGAVDRIRAVAADRARHDLMCRDMAARFGQLVDFDAEAEAIARFVG